MNHGINESLKFVSGLRKELIFGGETEIVICPPFTSLYSLSVALSEQKFINLGAQNCHWESSGAYTGEISPLFLKEVDCDYVILGHSERRHIFGETNDQIQKKIRAALDAEIKPIICVGETDAEREANKTLEVVANQMKAALKAVEAQESHLITFAYEPVWAIGTGKNATPAQAQEVHAFIREELNKAFQAVPASIIRILYGGSVKPENTEALMKEVDIDGLLIGGASLNLDSFVKIVQYRQNLR